MEWSQRKRETSNKKVSEPGVIIGSYKQFIRRYKYNPCFRRFTDAYIYYINDSYSIVENFRYVSEWVNAYEDEPQSPDPKKQTYTYVFGKSNEKIMLIHWYDSCVSHFI